MRPTTPG